MTQTAILTKWRFVVEFQDEETEEVSGTIGHADSREQCEALIEYDIQFHSARGRMAVNAEAVEVCAKCDGQGIVPAGNDGRVICEACGGHLGPISNLRCYG